MRIIPIYPVISRPILLLIVFLSFSPALLNAEIIHLNSGKVIEGIIVVQDEDMIKIDTGLGIPVTYFKDEIASIGEPSIEKPEQRPLPVKPEPTEPPQEKRPPPPIPPKTIKPNILPEKADLNKFSIMKPLTEPPPVETQPSQALKTPTPKEPYSATKKEDSGLNSGKRQEHLLFKELTQQMNMTVKIAPQEKKPHLIRDSEFIKKTDAFILQQMNGFFALLDLVYTKIPFVKQTLYEIPLRVRKDVLIFSSAFLTAIYILICFPMMKIARKLEKKNIGLVWIPIIQIFYFIYMASKPAWLFILFFIPPINLVIPLVLFSDILKALNKSFWLILLIIVPGINIFVLWYLAISSVDNN